MDNKLVQKFEANTKEIARVEAEITKVVAQQQTKLASLKTKNAEFRTAIKEAMEKNNVKKFEDDNVAITLIAATTRTGIDTKKLKEDAPGIYDKYKKVTPVSASIRITVK